MMAELISVKESLPIIERINFYDEVFVPNKVWLNEFTERYEAEIDLPFYCMFYPGTCNDETAKLLKEAGLAEFGLGFNLGQKESEKIYLKGITQTKPF